MAKHKGYLYYEGHDIAKVDEGLGPKQYGPSGNQGRRVLVLPLIYAKTTELEGTHAYPGIYDSNPPSLSVWFENVLKDEIAGVTYNMFTDSTAALYNEDEDFLGLPIFRNFNTNIKKTFTKPYNSDQEIYLALRNNIRNSDEWKALFDYSLLSNLSLIHI